MNLNEVVSLSEVVRQKGRGTEPDNTTRSKSKMTRVRLLNNKTDPVAVAFEILGSLGLWASRPPFASIYNVGKGGAKQVGIR